jgi:hypothetical protein
VSARGEDDEGDRSGVGEVYRATDADPRASVQFVFD